MDFRSDITSISLVVSHELWAHAKGPFTPAELRIKQAVWEWFSALPPQELERVRTPLYALAAARRSECSLLHLCASRTRARVEILQN